MDETKSPANWAKRIIADYAAKGKPVPVPAMAYVGPMLSLPTLDGTYFADDAETVCMYAFSNLSGWRGDEARAVKAEYKAAMRARGWNI